ncbi:MAG: fused MFS/spermidine synthase [Bacteroidota bacterium]
MRSASIKFIVILLFIFSGICGLIYEVAWSKYLSLFIGNTAYSIMIVLATFMSGLALGSYYWGKYADRSTNRLKLYGMLELAIGVYCLFYPLLIGICEKIFVAAATGLDAASDQVLLLLLKFLLSFTTLIIPTFFMGGTLPVLTKFLTRTIRDAGKDVATLYYINSMGAVFGAGLAGFFLIRLYSLDGAVAIAAVLNLLIGSIALIVARKVQGIGEPEIIPAEVLEPTDQPSAPSIVRLAIITAAMSGFIAMVYELTWTRLLANILGSSTYSFSLMLIAFISGITLGSWIVSLVIGRIKNLTLFLGLCQLGTAVAMIATLPFYERLPYYLTKISFLLSNKPENFPYFLACEFLFCFILMIIPTSLSGMSLPIASRIASNDLRLLGKSIGGIFSINTIGTVGGALIAGLLLIPQFGIKATIEIAVLLNIFLGLGIVFYDGRLPLRWRIGIASFVAIIGIGYRVEFPSWNQHIAVSGVFRSLFLMNYPSFEDMKEGFSRLNKILWYKEGLNANVAIVETPLGDKIQKSLIINGKADASTISDLPTQILLAQTPLLMAPDSGDALVIGLGSGITCGSALRHPLRSLDCVEISSEVVECNSFFTSENHDFLRDPRTKLYVDDAITFLKIGKKKYNCIISEPTNPWIAGVGNLFSLEFFNLCRDRLQPGGVLTQWFHTYDQDNKILRIILRTIGKSFQNVSIWKISDLDMLLVASNSPLPLDINSIENKIAKTAIKEELARINLFDVSTFLSLQVTSKIDPDILSGDEEINTEKRPLLEFDAPVALFSHAGITLIDSMDQRFSPSGATLYLNQYTAQRELSLENYLNIAGFRYFTNTGDDQMAYASLKKCLELSPDNNEALIMVSKYTLKYVLLNEGTEALRRMLRLHKEHDQIISNVFAALVDELETEDSLNLDKVDYVMKLGDIFGESGWYSDAARVYERIFNLYKEGKIPADNHFEEKLTRTAAQYSLMAGDVDNAKQFIEMLRQINPSDEQLPILTKELLNKTKGAS